MTTRAEIIETGDPKLKSASIIINAPASAIFSILADPKQHPTIDGSQSVRGVISGPDRLSLGSKFGMAMKIGVRYRITNTVCEFRENEVIAWHHIAKWIWRYELREIAPTQTLVIESFDGRPSRWQWWLKRRKAYDFAQIAVAKTLVRLKEVAEKAR